MSNIERSYGISDVLDLSKKTFNENTADLAIDVKDILSDYVADYSHITDKRSLKRVLKQMSSELQVEESISTLLLAMKSSQSKTFSNQSKHILNSKTSQQDFNSDQKNNKHKIDIDDALKNDDFHMTSEMSRKILDHQFVTRQKMINTQLEKALLDISLTRFPTAHNNDFIPTTTNQEFIALVGFNKVVDILQHEQRAQNVDGVSINSTTESLCVCVQCGTDASPAWKKLKMDENTDETICSVCSDKLTQLEIRTEYEDKIRDTKSKFEEQERNLIRDYNDMLSSPKKLELFRQEQEKRQRLQRIGNMVSSKATNRLAINSSQNIKPLSNKQNLQANNRLLSEGKNTGAPIIVSTLPGKLSAQRTLSTKDLINARTQLTNSSVVNSTASETTPAQLTYLQFLQAFTAQATNSQQYVDKENLQKLEQILAMVQANPVLANNNMTVLQLIANLSNNQENSSGSTNSATSNANLLNLLSYFVNLMQTQQSQSAL